MLPTIHIEFERWKFNKERNIYVSTLGRVKNSDKRIIKPYKSNGYLIIPQGKIHRIVTETFLGKSSLTVDHLDSNKENNKLSNLEYVPKETNELRAEAKYLPNILEIGGAL